MLKRLFTSPFRKKPAATALDRVVDTAAEVTQTLIAAVEQATDKQARGEQARGEAPAKRAVERLKAAPIAPALLLVTGAGVAFWYWTQWARGQAESDAAAEAKDDPPAA